MIKQEVWIITNKERTIIAKGTPRNRCICDMKSKKKRILTYASKGKAESAFKRFGFYNRAEVEWDDDDLVAVKCNMSLKEIK